ncbi:unnamed protein product [Protopolystoma xenopodis]|uniref:Uncharacterized protein n=1 Tax=Protopolystoma xenopodis TaxID=117903 RepID=A0A3S5A7Z4_9PLAT|nr:unnamed protein product [Protopolystoma xenopodis]
MQVYLCAQVDSKPPQPCGSSRRHDDQDVVTFCLVAVSLFSRLGRSVKTTLCGVPGPVSSARELVTRYIGPRFAGVVSERRHRRHKATTFQSDNATSLSPHPTSYGPHTYSHNFLLSSPPKSPQVGLFCPSFSHFTCHLLAAKRQNHRPIVSNLDARKPSILVPDYAMFEELERMMPTSMPMPVSGSLPLPRLRNHDFSSFPHTFCPILRGCVSGLKHNRRCENEPLTFFPLNRENHTPLVLQVDIRI